MSKHLHLRGWRRHNRRLSVTHPSVHPLPQPVQQPLQLLRLLHEQLHGGLRGRGRRRRRAPAVALDGLAHDGLPRAALGAEERGELVLDLARGAGTLVPERGVELHGGGARARELERVRAGRDPAAADERDGGGERGAQPAERRERELLERGAGEPALLALVGWEGVR